MMIRLSDHLDHLLEYVKASHEAKLIQTVEYPDCLVGVWVPLTNVLGRSQCLWGPTRLLQTSTARLCEQTGGRKK